MDNGNISSSFLCRNPFDGGSFETEGQDAQLCPEEVFDMSGSRLQQELDEENKLVLQEDSANGPDFSSPSLVPSMSSISGGSDTMLLSKLGITQYLTYKSEPLGNLGSPLTPTKRPWFGNTILSPRREIPDDIYQKEEEATELSSISGVNLEPSWLKNQSLSLLSESEQFEIPAGSKENSQDWLTGLPACSNIPDGAASAAKPKYSNLTYSKDLSYLINSENSGVPDVVYLSHGGQDACKNSFNVLRDNQSLASSKDLSIEPIIEMSSVTKDVSTSRSSEIASARGSHPSPKETQRGMGCNPALQELESGESSINPLTTPLKNNEGVDEASQSHGKEDLIQSRCSGDMSHLSTGSRKSEAGPPLQDSMALPGESRKPSLTGISFTQNPDSTGIPPGSGSIVGRSEAVEDSKGADEETSKDPAAAQNLAEEGELPSCYWRSAFPADCMSKAEIQPCLEQELPVANSCSYVVGTVEPALSCSPNLCRSASPSSQSDASTVRANPSQFCVNSVLTDEPQLSSTREISDDDDSTPRVKAAKATVKPTADIRDPGGAADGIGVESILKLFANTTSLPTPCLMDRVRNYISERQKTEVNYRGEIEHGEISSGLGESHFGGESSSCSSGASDGDTPVNPGPKKPVTFNKMPFPRHLSLPVHSTPLAPALRSRPLARPAVISEKEEFAHVTATVMKKKKAPAASGCNPAAPVPEDRLKNAPVVKCNKSHVFFGGVSLRDTCDRLETVTLRNSSFDEAVDLELRIEENSPFKILTNAMGKESVSKRLEKFGPREEKTVTVKFQPNFAGVFEAKLNLYPRGEQLKRIKYTVDLFGYAGESLVRPLHQADVIHPQLTGNTLKHSLTLANSGTIAGFGLISVVNDDGTALKYSRLLVAPECFTLNPKETREIQLLIDFPSAADARPFNLIATYGDEILRRRWTRAIMNGAEWKNPSGLELTKLVQLGSGPCGAAVVPQDVELFSRNLKKQKIRFSPQVSADDSQFVTLRAESTTTSLLQSQLVDKTDPALDTLLSQRRLTSTVNIKKVATDKDGQVCLGTSEIAFPATRVGAVSTQRIPLQNWSPITQEIRIVKITGPFSVRHLRSAIPAGFYSKLPVLFHPVKPGAHVGTVLLEVGTNNYPLTVRVRGEAV